MPKVGFLILKILHGVRTLPSSLLDVLIKAPSGAFLLIVIGGKAALIIKIILAYLWIIRVIIPIITTLLTALERMILEESRWHYIQ